MLLHHGAVGGTRVLSSASVDEMRAQPGGALRHHATTTRSASPASPATASGAGPTSSAPTAPPQVVSGNGGKGFYPWIDLTSRTWGVLGVQDDRGAELAVPASQQVEVAAARAVDG